MFSFNFLAKRSAFAYRMSYIFRKLMVQMSEVNLAYLEAMLVHPTRCQFFGNTLGLICKLDLALHPSRAEIVAAITKERSVFFSYFH